MSVEHSFSIREANASDMPGILDLSLALFKDPTSIGDRYTDHAWSHDQRGREFFKSCIEKSDHIMLVAVVDAKLVGYLAGSIAELVTWRPIKQAELLTFYVEPEYRSQGVGAELCYLFFTWSKEHKAVTARVSAYADNERGIAFYKKMGFKPYSLELEIELKKTEDDNWHER